ncbi:MAG: ribonuclease R [Thermodesulfovibrionales bacterium]
MLNRQAVSDFFRAKGSRPLHFKEIIQLMELSRPEARSLKRVLRDMLRDGELVLNRKGMYGPAEAMSLATGYFEAHRDGYGFVVPEKPGERDFFVPPKATQGAMKGDRVMVRVENWKKREARIIRVLERAYARVVGTLEITKAGTYVKPRDRSVPFDLYIAPKNRSTARNGDMVIAEIESFPTDKRPPSARVVKVLQRPEDPRAEVELIIDEFNLPRRFPKAAQDDAKSVSGRAGLIAKNEKRSDLRRLPTVTIDGERARDFDDAVSIRKIDNGYRLWVHIADVSAYVEWDSALDLEARARGTSVYFPDRVIPMLPRELSEDLCSLRPKEDRLAFTAEMEFDMAGARTSSRFYPSVIRSDERMTYTAVKKILIDRDADERQRYEYLLDDFELMGELCRTLRKRRFGRGSLDFDLPEPEVLLDLQGNPEAIITAERNFAHFLIEEFMIAANEAVAEFLEESAVPSIYRIHEEPDPTKLDDLVRIAKAAARAQVRNFGPKDFPALLLSVKDTPIEEIVNYLVLRSMKQARYATTNVGHFGLASKSYTHFTSPIRRYPDLVVHRLLREVLSAQRITDRRIQELASLLPDIAFSSSRTERAADDAENQVIRAMRAWFMKDKVGEEFRGRVVSITPYGLKIRLKDFYVEGFLHVSVMTDDFYQYNERTLRLVGRNTGRSYKLGQELTVRLDTVDMEEREIHFGQLDKR